jgi:hypothetical protein
MEEGMKIYVVESNCADGVFSTEEKAKEFMNRSPDVAYDLVCLELDNPDSLEEIGIFGAWFDSEGRALNIGPEGLKPDELPAERFTNKPPNLT